eukprot:TRINITY_DN3803_c0_g1_i1.p1 TRINITY_DN3803_c0_g1~~TRINITY_DN3803_c0_g1_i1.p1  ORF type:complete len:138 (-),score=9.67 TRINITY_DN3803_c0_g1_i1:13-426(-)
MSDVVRGPTESAFNDETQSYDSVCEYTKLIEQEIQLEERKHQLMLESLHAARTISHQQEQILSKLTSQLALVLLSTFEKLFSKKTTVTCTQRKFTVSYFQQKFTGWTKIWSRLTMISTRIIWSCLLSRTRETYYKGR